MRCKDVCEGKLRVYENGAVFLLKDGVECVPTISNTEGYASVRLPDQNYLIHRLVAEAFIPNPQNKPQVNHKDGNKRNNNVDNLEWVTARENNLHAIAMGLRGSGKKLESARFTVLTAQEIGLIDQIAKLPPEVQDKFLLMAQGAAVAVEAAREAAAAAAPAEEAEDGGAA